MTRDLDDEQISEQALALHSYVYRGGEKELWLASKVIHGCGQARRAGRVPAPAAERRGGERMSKPVHERPKPQPMAPCAKCGHSWGIHDTGWDACGCMVGDCTCRSYVPLEGYGAAEVAK